MKDILKVVLFGALFAIPFLTLYVESDFFFPYITGKNFAFRILVEIAFASWLLLALYDRDYRPKFSWLLAGFGTLLVVMFFANLFGKHPSSSFWSNFERMDGYVTLVHTFLYFIVLGSVLTTKKLWQYYLNTTLVVAFCVTLYGLAQYGGLIPGGGRIDSQLGNPAYFAIYLLFHIFITFWLFVESKQTLLRVIYGLLAAMFVFALLETGTRGTAIGFVVGLAGMVAYIGLFGARFKEFRKYAIGLFILIMVVGGAFFAARDSEFVQSNGNLARIANISIDDLTVRATIWGLAVEGVKERPLLGWGQSNFNFVFNEHYDPALYAQEQWFDRVHNIIFDWLITGGILGLLSYLSIFVACAYYLFLRPILRNDDDAFNVLERGVLIGILGGYFTHNIVVFDNIVSYMFFAIILAVIHSRVATPIKEIDEAKIDKPLIVQFAAPVVLVSLVGAIYILHVPGIKTAHAIIEAFRLGNQPALQLEAFEEAVANDSFAYQEVTEQFAQRAMNVHRNQNVSPELREKFVRRAEEELTKLVTKKPDDARAHVFFGTFYRAVGQNQKALEQMNIARSLSPQKQSIIIQQGILELSLGNNAEAHQLFEEAYELDTENLEAFEFYIASLFYVDRGEEVRDLIDSDSKRDRISNSDFVMGAASEAGDRQFMTTIFDLKIEQEPEVAQHRASKAFVQYQSGETAEAIETLRTGAEEIATFRPMAECIIGNIEAGREPGEGC